MLFCLFECELTELIVHQKPEAVHFGFDLMSPLPDDGSPPFEKFRKSTMPSDAVIVPWRDPSLRVVNVAQLAASKLASSNPAEFAFQLTEVVESVRFLVSKPIDNQTS